MPIARDGFPMLGGTLAVAVIGGLVATFGTGGAGLVGTVVGIAGVVLFLFLLNFFRDPERSPEGDDQALITPADGRVIIVKSMQEDRFLSAPATQISIFMSPLDVHVNRIPIDGEIQSVQYHPGKYFAAYSDKASLDNEQNAVVMRARDGRSLAFVQIAGFLARRIVCRLTEGEQRARGERMGMIKLGSRVDVFVPGGFDVAVKVGDRVRAGETILGRLQ